MVMIVATDAVVVRPVGKLDAIQQAHTDELFHRPEDLAVQRVSGSGVRGAARQNPDGQDETRENPRLFHG